MSNTNESKKMINAMGEEVPVRYVSAYDKAKDKAVRKIHALWIKQRKELESVVASSLKELDALLKVRAAGGTPTMAERGNFSARSFDGMLVVQVDQQYRITLDDRVLEAQRIMVEFASKVVGKIGGQDGQAIAAIVKETFAPTRSGTLSTAKVLNLLRLEITAPEWLKARHLLDACIQPVRGKAYIRVGAKKHKQKDYEYIRLDAADCWPTQGEVEDAK